jgi:hypothetical protein
MAVDYALQGVWTPYPWLNFLPKTQYGIAQQWFVNRVPLQSRLRVLPTNNYKFNQVTYKFRPRQVNIVADPTTGTSITVLDGSFVLNGDTIKLPSGEFVEVTADPTINQPSSNDVLTVRRGIGTQFGSVAIVGATAITTGADGSGIGTSHPAYGWLTGNSRTGGEKFQKGIMQVPTTRPQYVQTFQHVVQTSGIIQAMGSGLPLPAGIPTPFEKNKMDSLQSIVDDVENAFLYGVGEDLSTTNQRAKTTGLFSLIQTNAVTSPQNASAYQPTDFMHDCIAPIRANGGKPSLMMVSNNFMIGLAKWGFPLQRFLPAENGGMTRYGVQIESFRCPFLGDIEIAENMWLNQLGYAAIVLTAEEAAARALEEVNFKAYGRTGDTGVAGEGDWIGRMGLELENEYHHSYVTGITGFAQQT